jgi:hypothetical protein
VVGNGDDMEVEDPEFCPQFEKTTGIDLQAPLQLTTNLKEVLTKIQSTA